MRIYTHDNQLHYVNAISSLNGGEDVNGSLYYIQSGLKFNTLEFQRGNPQLGINGMFNEQLLAVLIHRIGVLDSKMPCAENTAVLEHLNEALSLLECRDRQMRMAPITTDPMSGAPANPQ